MNSLRQPLNLLVADDDPACREALVEFFVREGFHVLCATRGDEALEFMRECPVDLSVLDVHMPGLTGPQIVQRLLADPLTVMVPPTVLTSSDPSAESLLDMLPGARVDFIPKPIRLDALRRSVAQLLRPPDYF